MTRITNAEEFIRLCDSDDPAVYRLAATSEADESVWREIIDLHPERRLEVATNKKLPPSILSLLAEDPELRVHIAIKRSLPDRIFELLSRDENSGVRQMIADNIKTSLDILERLILDIDPHVRETAQAEMVRRAS